MSLNEYLTDELEAEIARRKKMAKENNYKIVNGQINQLLEQARGLISQAEAIADANGVSFSWEGLTYGMGGFYQAKGEGDSWESSSTGWQASSQSC